MPAHSHPSDMPAALVRRDCEPHRGPFLNGLGALVMILGVFSLCFFLPSLFAIPLGLWVCVAARHDLTQMDAGLMDFDGQEAALRARVWAANGLVLSVVAWLLWGFLACNSWPGIYLLFDAPDR